ncbi:hypothetical protein AMATHDRAFT_51001 [Amanita thiersii Skay4041]|uniref:Uncharacterized protein n=1 Tax=Amanita thiersii Skay4041 TaxID=703135 RepID=A0A2A9NFK5_9AGAR|nr:hypothetical protein AMATHDRAFT_51001 [Amanita thiersii Skay4041]
MVKVKAASSSIIISAAMVLGVALMAFALPSGRMQDLHQGGIAHGIHRREYTRARLDARHNLLLDVQARGTESPKDLLESLQLGLEAGRNKFDDGNVGELEHREPVDDISQPGKYPDADINKNMNGPASELENQEPAHGIASDGSDGPPKPGKYSYPDKNKVMYDMGSGIEGSGDDL